MVSSVTNVSLEIVELAWKKVNLVENESVELLKPNSVVLDTCGEENEDSVEIDSFETEKEGESQHIFGKSNPPTFSFPQIKLL